MRRSTVLVTLVSMLVGMVATSVASADQATPTRYVITYSTTSVPGAAGGDITAAGGTLVRTLPQVGVAIAASDEPGFAQTLAANRRVHAVGEVDALAVPAQRSDRTAVTVATVPDPPAAFFELQWGIGRVHAPAAWDAGHTGSHDTVVAVIDTGVASNHPDLADNLVFNGCFSTAGDHTTGDCLPYPSQVPDDAWHGTHVAGIVAATFGGGVVGVGPDLGIANYNVFEVFPDGQLLASVDSVWAAMIDAADNGFDVINMSLGGIGNFADGRDVAATRTATQRVSTYVRQQGTVIVAAAGNDALDLDGPLFNWPGGVAGIVNVGATGIRPEPRYPQDGAFDVVAFYSNRGAAVSLVAPGGDCGLDDGCIPGTPPDWFEFLILSADVYPVDEQCAATASCPIGWIHAAGTSMAAPHVAGVAGLVRDAHPQLSPQQVEARLTRTAERLGDRRIYGHGMVDASSATTRR